MRNSYRFAVILPGWSGHKLPSESSVQRKQTTEHETAQTSNTGGSITVMSHLPPLTYALSVHSFCELRSQRKTTTLSSSLAAVLLASRSTYHHQNYNIIFITGCSPLWSSPSTYHHHFVKHMFWVLLPCYYQVFASIFWLVFLFFELLSHSPTRPSSF